MTTYNWTIANLERETDTGGVGTGFVPFDQLTEADVLAWVHASEDKDEMEAKLATQIEDQKAPKTAVGTLWQKRAEMVAKCRSAVARLAQYKVADGRPEITEEQPTGEYDEEGNEITETVVVQTAIDPVEPTVEQPVYDDEGNQTGTETVTNPLIVADEAERAAAQAVIDQTPQEVKDFE